MNLLTSFLRALGTAFLLAVAAAVALLLAMGVVVLTGGKLYAEPAKVVYQCYRTEGLVALMAHEAAKNKEHCEHVLTSALKVGVCRLAPLTKPVRPGWSTLPTNSCGVIIGLQSPRIDTRSTQQ